MIGTAIRRIIALDSELSEEERHMLSTRLHPRSQSRSSQGSGKPKIERRAERVRSGGGTRAPADEVFARFGSQVDPTLMPLYLEPEADPELEDAALRYEQAVPELGLEFLAQMRERTDRIVDAPLMYPRFGRAKEGSLCTRGPGRFPT